MMRSSFTPPPDNSVCKYLLGLNVSSFMHFLVLGFSAFLIGFIAAIPVSASQLEVARRAIQGYVASALLLILGGSLSDLFYGFVAFFGIRSFLNNPLVDAIFWLVNAAFLVVLGIYTIRHSKARQGVDTQGKRSMADLRVAFITGFTLSIVNPLMISWWLIGARLLEDAGILWESKFSTNMVFLGSAAVGLASYSVLLIVIFSRWKRSLSPRAIRRITVWFGVALICLAAYFTVRSVVTFVKLRHRTQTHAIFRVPDAPIGLSSARK